MARRSSRNRVAPRPGNAGRNPAARPATGPSLTFRRRPRTTAFTGRHRRRRARSRRTRGRRGGRSRARSAASGAYSAICASRLQLLIGAAPPPRPPVRHRPRAGRRRDRGDRRRPRRRSPERFARAQRRRRSAWSRRRVRYRMTAWRGTDAAGAEYEPRQRDSADGRDQVRDGLAAAHRRDRGRWHAALAALSTDRLAGELNDADPQTVPADRITGPVTQTDHAATSSSPTYRPTPAR